MSLPDFGSIDFNSADASAAPFTRSTPSAAGASWETPEGIPHRALYTATDLVGIEHLGSLPGLPPYVRGPYPTMYVRKPWTVRQYAGFSTAEDSNAFYRRNLEAGQ